jgi:hypothetical protein
MENNEQQEQQDDFNQEVDIFNVFFMCILHLHISYLCNEHYSFIL